MKLSSVPLSRFGARPVVAGLLLGGLEAAYVGSTQRALFLSDFEAYRFGRAALFAGAALAVLLAWLGGLAGAALFARGTRPEGLRRLAWTARAAVFSLSTPALWLLTEGRRVRDLPGRPVLVVLAAALGALAAGWLAPRLAEVRERGGRGARGAVTIALVGAAIIALYVDATVLVRGYPAFHWGLALGALAAQVIAFDVVPLRNAKERARLALGAVGCVAALICLIVAPLTLAQLRDLPNARAVAEERAPLVGKAVLVFRRVAPLPHAPPARVARVVARAPDAGAAVARGIDLRQRDVLLVTVDALRADRLEAYGGHGLTPELDALAREGAVFERAYTSTPHTSYALCSLLTGKMLRPVLDLPAAPPLHPTVADLVRRYGVRTAAFYPPAIFFVDEQRFAAMRDAGLGFEYRKAMFASAHDRVAQVSTYLSEVEPGHPVFVWVHLFEPHEPYAPEPRFARGDTAEQRYDGEVAQSDDAIGELVRAFRSARPGATVIVTADHGEEFGDHGGHYHGTTLYDEQVRVPVIWSSPGAVAPRRIRAPIETIDLGTTLLAALGIPRDARMRGDDLGPLLAGSHDDGPTHAFSGLGNGAWMVTDGAYKALCAADGECRLFDLLADPRERQDRSAEDPARLAELRSALGAFVGSIPRVEALALAGDVGWPEPLARAELGDPTAGPDVVPLLGHPRADVRAAAARALGALRFGAGLAVLSRLREGDPDADVRAEAAVTALVLGDDAAREQVAALLALPPDAGPAMPRPRRAALALAGVSDARAVPVLTELAIDAQAGEVERLAAIRALGALQAATSVGALAPLLDDVRLRLGVADALGEIGDRHAIEPLRRALHVERYLPARTAEARALLRLGDRRVLTEVRRFLGMETPMPDGVALLLDAGALARPSAEGADLRTTVARRGAWAESEQGAHPLDASAQIMLPAARAPRGETRVVLRLIAPADDTAVTLDGVTRTARAGTQELAWPYARSPRALQVAGDVHVLAIAVVTAQAELPPPPPEDAGLPNEPDAGSSTVDAGAPTE